MKTCDERNEWKSGLNTFILFKTISVGKYSKTVFDAVILLKSDYLNRLKIKNVLCNTPLSFSDILSDLHSENRQSKSIQVQITFWTLLKYICHSVAVSWRRWNVAYIVMCYVWLVLMSCKWAAFSQDLLTIPLCVCLCAKGHRWKQGQWTQEEIDLLQNNITQYCKVLLL